MTIKLKCILIGSIVTFLLLPILLIGIYGDKQFKKFKKIETDKYVIGTALITMICALALGLQPIVYMEFIFDNKILYPILIVCGVLTFCFLFIVRYINSKLISFKECSTPAGVMGKLYGTKVRILVGILGIFYL